MQSAVGIVQFILISNACVGAAYAHFLALYARGRSSASSRRSSRSITNTAIMLIYLLPLVGSKVA